MTFNSEYAETIHRHVVMWLDEHIGVPGNNETMKERFRRVSYPLHTFTDVQSAIKFVYQQQSKGKTIFLIVSGTFAQEIVPQISNLDCLRQIFLFCGNILHYKKWAEDYIEKILMFDFDEDLLIRFTNEIANYFIEEAERYKREDKIEQAAGLLDWADWLYNDADTLQRETCKKIRQDVQKRRQKLSIDYQIANTNHFA